VRQIQVSILIKRVSALHLPPRQDAKADGTGNVPGEHGEEQYDDLVDQFSSVSIISARQNYTEQFARKLMQWRRSFATDSDEYKLLSEAYSLIKMVRHLKAWHCTYKSISPPQVYYTVSHFFGAVLIHMCDACRTTPSSCTT
jgi:hypothetical protein